MKDFIKVELMAKVSGFDVNDDGTIQIQNVSFNKNDELVKNTIKIHKRISEEELKKVVGKVVKVENVKEYRNGFKTYYAGDNIRVVSDSNVDFEVKKEMDLRVDNVSVKDKDTKLQSIVQNGNRTDLFNIKIKGVTGLQGLKGKTVKIKDVVVMKTDFGTFYNSKTAPEIIG